jgi:hypothetical protein
MKVFTTVPPGDYLAWLHESKEGMRVPTFWVHLSGENYLVCESKFDLMLREQTFSCLEPSA